MDLSKEKGSVATPVDRQENIIDGTYQMGKLDRP